MVRETIAGANGSAAAITFADQVTVAQEFTRDEDSFSAAFGKLHSAGARKGRLIDAVSKGLDLLANAPPGARSVFLIIGESKDRGSETQLPDLLPAIQRSGVTIYSLAYSAYLTAFTTKASEYTPPQAGRGWILDSITELAHAASSDTCKLLTAATGGRQLKFETKSKLENDLIRLGADVHSRYILSFAVPPASRQEFHNVSVEISGGPGLHVDARPGYWTDENPIAR